MKKTNKKGFTIVELVIVIAVIAILSAVLIPTFSGVVKSARLSADKKAVNEMNKVLATKEIEEANIFLAFEALEEAGMNADGYKALSKDMRFFWDAAENRVIMVDDTTNKVVFPEKYEGNTYNGKWQTLTQEIKTEQPNAGAYDDGTVTVANGNQLAYVLDSLKDGNKDKVDEIVLPAAGVDMMGAALDFKVNTNVTIAGGTIKNATTVDANKTHVNGGDGHDGFYNAALFPSVESGKTLKLENVTFENVNIKDINGSNVAILVGLNSGKVILNNVTIKNSTVIGHHNVGVIAGNANSGTYVIGADGVKIENVEVLAVGGRVGQVFGFCNTPNYTGSTGKITISNVTTGIYNCEANTGSYNGTAHGTALGLANGQITSTEVLSDGSIEVKARPYYANTLIGKYENTSVAAQYEALKALIA